MLLFALDLQLILLDEEEHLLFRIKPTDSAGTVKAFVGDITAGAQTLGQMF